MNYSLQWKYFRRENLWLKWLPVYVLLIEGIIPIKLTVFPFFFLKNIFCEFNSMLPCSIKSIQMTNYRLVDCVRSNNLLLILVGSIIHLLVGCVVILLFIFTKDKYDLRPLYDFIPLLLASVLIGNLNIYLNFSNFRIHRIIQFIIYFVFLLLVYFLAQYSVQLYLLMILLCIVAIFSSYKMLENYD